MDVAGFIVGDRVISQSFSTHPDWNAGFGRYHGFSFVGASAIGKKHLKEGKGREDCFLIRSKGEWLLFLLADGVGSAPLGAWGASLAVNFFAEEFLRGLPAGRCKEDASLKEREKRWRGYGAKLAPPLSFAGVGTLSFYRKRETLADNAPFPEEEPLEGLFLALEQTHNFLLASARRENHAPQDLSTTLLGLLLDTFSGKGLAFQIGDGLILGVSGDECFPLLEVGDFEVGETAVLTQENWREWCRFGFFVWEERKLEAVFLMTDGVADDCLYAPPEDITSRFGKDLLRELKRFPDEETVSRRLLFWLSEYRAPSSFDDRTLVAVYR
ncbi:MAG: protein phosphatase 2C domain-containing protein [Candidatus Caldatribacteriaceae bacterium]